MLYSWLRHALWILYTGMTYLCILLWLHAGCEESLHLFCEVGHLTESWVSEEWDHSQYTGWWGTNPGGMEDYSNDISCSEFTCILCWRQLTLLYITCACRLLGKKQMNLWKGSGSLSVNWWWSGRESVRHQFGYSTRLSWMEPEEIKTTCVLSWTQQKVETSVNLNHF